jgi:hypothetical protein
MNRAASRMIGRHARVAVACLLVVAAAGASIATAGLRQAVAARPSSGTWIARSSTGQTLTGTWKAEINTGTGAVTGSWTLDSPAGKVIARGVWSATKASSGWSGRLACGSGRPQVGVRRHLDRRGHTRDERIICRPVRTSVKGAVGGAWRTGRQSGQWSIRAAN